jgi:glycosyltransferase involved in cell wall biosynthesis
MNGNRPIDIEVLVLTYNRAPLIGVTLESLLAQAKPASRICVLDNGSTDNTAEVVRAFAPRGVELVCRKRNDPCACWSDLQTMAQGPWTMLFHDDDLLHPNYLRDLAVALAHEPRATVAVSAMRVHQDPEHIGWEKVRASRYLIQTGRQLAASLYAGFPMPFCSAVYRTDILKRGVLGLETYGKIFDRPFVIEVARAGCAVVMLDRYVKYRIHASQDSADQASGPFLPEVFALQRYYRKVLGERLSDFPGRIFLCRNYRNLLGEFTRLNRNAQPPMLREAFFRDAINAEAASTWSLRYGAFYAALTRIPRQIERKVRSFRRGSQSCNS